MANYAVLDQNNIVLSVFQGKDETEPGPKGEVGFDWEAFYGAKRTSYNTKGGTYYVNKLAAADQTKSFRKNYAGIGFKYDPDLDMFIPPTPFPSWLLDETKGAWIAPEPYPADGKPYRWDEDKQIWVEGETKSA